MLPQETIPTETMTRLSGAPVVNNQNTVNTGRGYPVLPQDYSLLEETAPVNRERIPELTQQKEANATEGTSFAWII